MSENILRRMLLQINVRKGDDWYDPCCSGCYDHPYHRSDRYGAEPPTNRNRATIAVPLCSCVCHEAREVIGIPDPRNEA